MPAKHFFSNYHAMKIGKDDWLNAFDGQIKNMAVSFCDGAYRITDFENLYEGDLVASVGWTPKDPTDCNYPCETCETGARDICITCAENRAGIPTCECITGYYEP
jgi:hypothetical protein